MKTFFIFLLITLLFLCSYAFSNTSVIYLNGSLSESSCIVSSESDFTVDFGILNSKSFTSQKSSMPVSFTINLSECGRDAKGVKVGFAGVENSSGDGLLKIDNSTDSASGLAIQILASNAEKIPVNGDLKTLNWQKIKPNSSNSLVYYAQVNIVGKSLSPGKISSSATYWLEYQ